VAHKVDAKRILLTGGSGMLGSSLRDAFAKTPKYQVICPERRDLDLLQAPVVESFVSSGHFDLIVHCAAKVGGIQANIADPVGFLHENSIMNLNVISAARKAGVVDLIYLGSSCMYPRNFPHPLKEEDLLASPLEPTNEGYALSKILGYKLCQYSNRQFQTRYKTIVPPNLYGRYDHFDETKSHLIPAILFKIHQAKKRHFDSVVVWGDGSARREFLYADDLAGFVVTNMDRLGKFPDLLNVGYGKDFSVREFYEFGMEVAGFEGSLSFDASKPVGMDHKLMDSSQAANLGWKPETSPKQGMRLVYEHILTRVENA
jgi:GDP-L-fucose synthase